MRTLSTILFICLLSLFFVGTLTAQWVQTSLDSLSVRCFALSDTNLFASTSHGIYLSTNNGSGWTQKTTWSNPPFAISGSNLVAVADNIMYRSTNNGISWDSVGVWYNDLNVLLASDTNLFAGGSGWREGYPSSELSLSTDGGTTWKDIRSGLGGCSVNVLALSGYGLLAGVGLCPTGIHPAGVYQLRNNDTTWTNIGPKYYGINSLAANGTIIFTTMDSVIRSTDNGITWSALNTPFSDFSCMTQIGTNLFFGTGSGVYHSTNNGTSWTDVNTNLTDSNILALTISGSFLFAGTNGGVWKRPLSEMITDVPLLSTELPSTFMLSQNYPNPFNPSTTISYQLPTQTHVTLKIFDVLGREVATLVNGVEEPGYKSVNFNSNGLSSGVYYYRLRAGNYIETKKLLLLR